MCSVLGARSGFAKGIGVIPWRRRYGVPIGWMVGGWHSGSLRILIMGEWSLHADSCRLIGSGWCSFQDVIPVHLLKSFSAAIRSKTLFITSSLL